MVKKLIMSETKPDGFEKGGFRHRNITNGIINSKIPLDDKNSQWMVDWR